MSFWVDDWLPYIYQCHTLIKPPKEVDLLVPYAEREVRSVCDRFYNKYFSDNSKRKVLLGINPGRLGAGITGISFTDPEKLENHCGIPNDFPKKEELSSRFIYEWIQRSHLIHEFYQQFIILSVCPIGFVSKGKNLNYYDTPILKRRSEKLIIQQQEFLMTHQMVDKTVFMLGKGQNYKYFKHLNQKHNWYDHVIPLPHPRWVMQYRYKNRYVHMDEMMMTLMETDHE